MRKDGPREAVWLSLHPGPAKLQARKGKKMCGRWEASTTSIDSDYGVFFNFIAWKGQFFQWRKWQNNK